MNMHPLLLNMHPLLGEEDDVDVLLTILLTTTSLASHVGKLVTTKSGLASPIALKSGADFSMVELEMPSASACVMNLVIFAALMSYTVSCRFDNSSSFCLARLRAIFIPILPSPTKETLTGIDDDGEVVFFDRHCCKVLQI